MLRTILLVSRDAQLQHTRAMVLQHFGYATIETFGLALAMKRIASEAPDAAVIGHTFDALEQECFVETLHETHPEIPVLCLRSAIRSEELIEACEQCFQARRGKKPMWVVTGEEPVHLLAWPKRAS